MQGKYAKLIKAAADGEPDPNQQYLDAVPGAMSAMRAHLNIPDTYTDFWTMLPTKTRTGTDLYTETNLFGEPKYIGSDPNDPVGSALALGKYLNASGKYDGPLLGSAYRLVDNLGNATYTTKGIKNTLFELLDNAAARRAIREEYTDHTPNKEALDAINKITDRTLSYKFLNNLFLKNAPETIGGYFGGKFLKGKRSLKTKGGLIRAIIGDWLGGSLLSKLFSGWHASNAAALKRSIPAEDLYNARVAIGKAFVNNKK